MSWGTTMGGTQKGVPRRGYPEGGTQKGVPRRGYPEGGTQTGGTQAGGTQMGGTKTFQNKSLTSPIGAHGLKPVFSLVTLKYTILKMTVLLHERALINFPMATTVNISDSF